MNETVQRVLDFFGRLTDESVPGLVEGVYLVGSLALDDFCEGSSDIDFVGLLSGDPTPAQLAALAGVHRRVASRFPKPYLDGLYLTRSDLAAGPHRCQPTPAVHEHRFDAQSTFAHDQITWHTLAVRPMVVRGSALTDADVWSDKDALVEWVLVNVGEYWKPWLRAHSPLLSPGGLSALSGTTAVWGVLGMARMSYTATTGDIASKHSAGHYARSRFGPRWHPILDECLRLRTGSRTPSAYRSALARRRDVLAFVDMVMTELNP